MAMPLPKQQIWKWFVDDAAEPSSALAVENATPTLANNTSKIRLRVTLTNGGSNIVGTAFNLTYSTDNTTFTSLGAGKAWNNADGAGPLGYYVTSFKTSDGAIYGCYHENDSGTESISTNTFVEMDFCIVPTGTVAANTTYYFQLMRAGATVVPLGTGKTHPQVLTAAGGSSSSVSKVLGVARAACAKIAGVASAALKKISGVSW